MSAVQVGNLFWELFAGVAILSRTFKEGVMENRATC